MRTIEDKSTVASPIFSGDDPMGVTDSVRDHALEEALAFLALHEPSNRGPKATSENRATVLRNAARLPPTSDRYIRYIRRTVA